MTCHHIRIKGNMLNVLKSMAVNVVNSQLEISKESLLALIRRGCTS